MSPTSLKRVLTLIFVALCGLAISPAAAQHSVGIQAGAGTGWVRSDIFENHGGPALHPMLGLAYEHRFGEHLTLGADLLYQQRGFNDDLVLTDRSGLPMRRANLAFSYNYAALPVKVGYRFGNRIFGFGSLGLVPAVLLNAHYRRPEMGAEPSVRVDLGDESRRFDLSGIVEAGAGFRMGERLSFRTSLSFLNGITSFTDPWFRSRHLNLYLSLGVRYELAVRTSQPDAAQMMD